MFISRKQLIENHLDIEVDPATGNVIISHDPPREQKTNVDFESFWDDVTTVFTDEGYKPHAVAQAISAFSDQLRITEITEALEASLRASR